MVPDTSRTLLKHFWYVLCKDEGGSTQACSRGGGNNHTSGWQHIRSALLRRGGLVDGFKLIVLYPCDRRQTRGNGVPSPHALAHLSVETELRGILGYEV